MPKTKTYLSFYDRFNKKVLNGEVNTIDFFESIIIPTVEDAFSRRKVPLVELVKDLYESKKISKIEYDNIENLIVRKSKGQVVRAVVDFKPYFLELNSLRGFLSDESLWAFILLPLLYVTHLQNCVKFQYKDLIIKEIEDISLLIFHTDDKKHVIALDRTVSSLYKESLEFLIKTHGTNEYIFPQMKTVEWQLNKTSKALYKIFAPYVKANEEKVNHLCINSLIKRSIRETNFFKEI